MVTRLKRSHADFIRTASDRITDIATIAKTISELGNVNQVGMQVTTVITAIPTTNRNADTDIDLPVATNHPTTILGVVEDQVADIPMMTKEI
jgi:hypothetical protein